MPFDCNDQSFHENETEWVEFTDVEQDFRQKKMGGIWWKTRVREVPPSWTNLNKVSDPKPFSY